MDGEQAQLSDEDSTIVTGDHSRRRRRRKKAISLAPHGSMDQISVEFVLPAAARCKAASDKLLLDVAANWTVEQVGGPRGLVASEVFGWGGPGQRTHADNLTSQVKTQVWLRAVTLNVCPDFYQRFSPDQCILLYQKKGSVCEIYDKHQVFQTLDCVCYWRGTGGPRRALPTCAPSVHSCLQTCSVLSKP